MKLYAFGEVLFDVFGEEKNIGGAPLNVAYHFVKMGGEASVISAVGHDELGNAAFAHMSSNGIDTSLIYLSRYPTGRADVVMHGNEADYTFNCPCAWDDIHLSPSQIYSADIFYWGTLALRNRTSLKAFHELSSSVNARIMYYDVNIRKKYYSPDIIKEGLSLCNILKVNENELPLILEISGEKSVLGLMDKNGIDIVILTEGENGSTVYGESHMYKFQTPKITVCDTVGAGDSYSACFLYSYLMTGDIRNAGKEASSLSSFVCTKRGGMPSYNIDDVKF